MAVYTRFWQKVLAAASALNANGQAPVDQLGNVQQVTAYVYFGLGTASGAVVIEGSHDPNFSGTWAVLSTVNWAAADRVHIVQITGLHRALRARISTIIGGGTVDIYMAGN